MADWINQFLTEVKPSRSEWLTRFHNTFTVRSSLAGRRTLEIGARTGTCLPYEPDGEYVALEASRQLAAQFDTNVRAKVHAVGVDRVRSAIFTPEEHDIGVEHLERVDLTRREVASLSHDKPAVRDREPRLFGDACAQSFAAHDQPMPARRLASESR
jgi:hypothetical protein